MEKTEVENLDLKSKLNNGSGTMANAKKTLNHLQLRLMMLKVIMQCLIILLMIL